MSPHALQTHLQGDAYVAAAGAIPGEARPPADSARAVALLALRMQDFCARVPAPDGSAVRSALPCVRVHKPWPCHPAASVPKTQRFAQCEWGSTAGLAPPASLATPSYGADAFLLLGYTSALLDRPFPLLRTCHRIAPGLESIIPSLSCRLRSRYHIFGPLVAEANALEQSCEVI